MFTYNENRAANHLNITLPAHMKFNYRFLVAMLELIRHIIESKCSVIRISGRKEEELFDDRLSAIYFSNILLSLTSKKKITVKAEMFDYFSQIKYERGTDLREIDIVHTIASDEKKCFKVQDDDEIDRVVNILVEFIASQNIVGTDFREFLTTTIGEVFSNAFNHCGTDQVLFIYDIEYKNPNFYLVVNITDFGKTIAKNVQDYHEKRFQKTISSKDSMEWALKSGNTTREGSGGYGLPELCSYVNAIEGELLIFSDSSFVQMKGTNPPKVMQSKGYFNGTSVSMKIPLFDTSRYVKADISSRTISSISLDAI